MTKLLIATNNPGKVREYEELLAGLVDHRDHIPGPGRLWLDVEETGEPLRRTPASRPWPMPRPSGLLTLADDSGLEVDALGGAPGVHSARYAGPGADDVDRYREAAG